MAFGLSAGAAALVGAVAAPVVGSLFADDNGAEGANDAAAASTRLQTEIASDQWQRYKDVYGPLEREFVSDAQNYDSPENFARAAGEASSMVSDQFGKARDRLTRTPGLDPSSAGYASSLIGLDLAQAASDATQQNGARQRVRDIAYARKNDALSLGKGLPSSASTMLSTSANNNLALANAGTAQANQQAQMIGNVTNRLFNSGFNSGLFSASPMTPQGGYTAPGGAGFGMDLGFDV